jgi:organic radical activating enzyme
MLDTVSYPVAEWFHSVQGEGAFAGTQMHFIRLAGCNVGKALEVALDQVPLRVIAEASSHPHHTMCTSVTGNKFLCDTDYRAKHHANIPAMLADTWENYICLTGGEPFLHKLRPLVAAAAARSIQVHVETSGTVPIFTADHMWITCSPKAGYLRENSPFIDEFKFVVHSSEGYGVLIKIDNILRDILHDAGNDKLVFLQPVNSVQEVDVDEVHFVMRLLKARPAWRLSAQVHKLLGLR